MKPFLLTIFLFLSAFSLIAQATNQSCSFEAMLERSLAHNPNAAAGYVEAEIELQKIISLLRTQTQNRNTDTYIIPVVMHVFHNGDDGKMDMEQARAGLEILNNDFNGYNDGWETIDEAFDPVKGTLDINFCLASIDPEGNPTTGINYYEDENMINNQGNLFQHAWDNYKYLNIYFPKYTSGGPSDFTAYAYFPNTFNTIANEDGIFYSSIRWGYGNHSELDEGDDWASVCSHEAGHWLNLYHTFSGDCNNSGDLVDDTPPSLTSGIELAGCNNNDYSCNVHTNGENFMDYNHRCKKMFTQGQVERMTAALQLPSRVNLWSEANLIATGCSKKILNQEELGVAAYKVYPNPATEFLVFDLVQSKALIDILNLQGQVLLSHTTSNSKTQIDIHHLNPGIYYYSITSEGATSTGKFVVL